MLLSVLSRRGVDPGKPPFERERLIALLESDDAGGSVKVGDIGIRTGYLIEKDKIEEVRRIVQAGYCGCGCGGKLRNQDKQFLRGHHQRLTTLRKRIEEGLLDPKTLSESVQEALKQEPADLSVREYLRAYRKAIREGGPLPKPRNSVAKEWRTR